jgi:hypothetical protein
MTAALEHKEKIATSGQKQRARFGRTVAVTTAVMGMRKILTPAVFVATLALAAVPAYAGQHHGGGGHAGHGGHGGGAVSRGGGGARGGVAVSRGGVRGGPVYRGSIGVRGGFGGVRVAPRFIAPRFVGSRGIFFARRSFYHPYFAFRPRLSLGFGLWAGYPVAFPYFYDPYYYGYAYPYPADPYAYGYAAPSYGYPAQPYAAPNPAPAYPYPPSNDPNYQPQQAPSVGVEQGTEQSAPGGVSFDITPDNAAVFVDGTYVGTVGTFGPKAQPLGLIPGRHHIEIRASGYRTMTFDADVTPGQVIPYQGALQRD